ncbi:unnamed protein product [Paramecium pentaurelia]|uniref:Trichocyst matrix protein n=1 Tax=Paramecium pentaurelia TaxID=43138 RepID=A0A8S1W8Y3_9CILI|nr:unnamed protein product [Paramecium pentaurelia]
MKSTLSVLLVVLVSVQGFQSDMFSKHHIPNRNIMEIMMQIEAQLASGGPFDTINTMLQGFRTSVTSEQIAHDDLYARQKNECDSETAFRRGQIQDASKILSASTNQLNLCSFQRQKAKAEFGMTEDQLTMNQQHLSLIQEVRKTEQENFNKMAVIFQDALRVIDESVYLAKKFSVGDASLIELADATGQMMQHSVSLKRTGQYAAVLASLARISLAEQVSSADVDRLIQLLQTLRNNIEDSYNQFTAENNQAIVLYNNQKERIDKNIARLEKSKTRLEDQITDLNGCVATQTAISQAASNKKQRNQRLLDDATALCTTFNSEYENASAARRQELVLLSEVERLVEKRQNEVK